METKKVSIRTDSEYSPAIYDWVDTIGRVESDLLGNHFVAILIRPDGLVIHKPTTEIRVEGYRLGQ